MRITAIDRYPEHPLYLAAVASTVEASLQTLPAEERASAVLLVSAHGLPVRFIERGDPYEREIHATRDGLLRRLRERGIANPWRLGYQSRTGPVPWLGPSTDEVIRDLAREGTRAVVVVPIAFVSDHIETLYEIDQLFAGQARREGIPHFVRTRMLNDDPLYVEALAAMVREHLRGDVT
jgi:ferrochelatase